MILRETLEHRLGAPARLAALAIGLLILPLAPRPSTAQDPAPKPEGQVEAEVLGDVVVENLVGDEGAVYTKLVEIRDEAELQADTKDKGDLEARMKRLEERLEKLAALLEGKGGEGLTVRFTTPEKPEGVVVIRREDLKRLDVLKKRAARLGDVQVREARVADKLLDEAKARAAGSELDRAKAGADQAAKAYQERAALLGQRVEKLDEKLQKDAQALETRVRALRVPGFDQEHARKLADEIDALIKKHAEAGAGNDRLAEEIKDVIKKHVPFPPTVVQDGKDVRRIVVRPRWRVEPDKPGSVKTEPDGAGLGQRMDRLEKRLDELMRRLEEHSDAVKPKPSDAAKP